MDDWRVFLETFNRPGKICESSLQCPQNSDKQEQKYMYPMLSAYPQSIALNPQFWILNPQISVLLPQISFIQPRFPIFNSSFSILSKKYGIFGSKSPQNSVIFDKMSASAACTTCSFFQVWGNGPALSNKLMFGKCYTHSFYLFPAQT